ncbi:helix-turn-helix transcriptional regulator [Bacillus subtilis]|uniref:helix-turn-helix transcriptional regulator n=2 Tax=Bacillus mojavensis TaxID=72360 RepID=UPI002DB7A976|nr:helix-turn-helix transcriptional regulator [Bacillus mojavensis]MEC1625485.1 helix-turn-helix transcriptional regulator [Bacillus mojavensis]MED2969435.1 helix-turn-helix transcriptional regulator [Bacillus subtilis]
MLRTPLRMEVFITFKVGKSRIPELCENLGLEHAQLAAKVGLTKSHISDYISLRNIPSIERAYNIARILGCSPEDLYEWIEVSGNETEG